MLAFIWDINNNKRLAFCFYQGPLMGLEPTTSTLRVRRAYKLHHAPLDFNIEQPRSKVWLSKASPFESCYKSIRASWCLMYGENTSYKWSWFWDRCVQMLKDGGRYRHSDEGKIHMVNIQAVFAIEIRLNWSVALLNSIEVLSVPMRTIALERCFEFILTITA